MKPHVIRAGKRVGAWCRRRPVIASFLAIVAICVAILGVFSYSIHKLNDLAQSNKDNIAEVKKLAAKGAAANRVQCAYKLDLTQRLADSRKFLKHPPKRVLGIPVTPEVIASVKSQIANQQSVLDSYAGLPCPKPKPEPAHLERPPGT